MFVGEKGRYDKGKEKKKDVCKERIKGEERKRKQERERNGRIGKVNWCKWERQGRKWQERKGKGK